MKKVLKTILWILLILVAAVLIYILYAVCSYQRLEDHLPLPVSGTAQEQLEAGEPVRLLSYNLGFGAYSDDFSFFMDGGKESWARSPEAVRENLGGALEVVLEQDPDLVGFQEIDLDGTRSHHIDEREIVKAQLPGYASVFAQNYDSPYMLWPLNQPHGANQAGMMTFSRYPITSAVRRSLPIEKGLMKMMDLDRCYSVSRIPVDNGRELVLYGLHLAAYTSDGTIAEQQLEMLLQDMQKELDQGNYTVAAGDFNKDLLGDSGALFGVTGEEAGWAQPIPPEMIPEHFRLEAPFSEETPVASCRNADRPYGPDSFRVTVDGFLLSDNVRTVDCSVIDTGFRWSDHNPVRLDLILEAA